MQVLIYKSSVKLITLWCPSSPDESCRQFLTSEASAELEDASAAYRATDARVASERAVLAEELAEATKGCVVSVSCETSVFMYFNHTYASSQNERSLVSMRIV